VLRLKTRRLALSLVMLASAASAEANIFEREYPSSVVSYRDLDLGTVEGLRTLDGRVSRVVSQLCFEGGFKDLAERVDQRQCQEFATSMAQRDVQAAAERARLWRSEPVQMSTGR
jgi:UrcA family protein